MAATKKPGKAREAPAPAKSEKHVGSVEHYYPKAGAAAVKLDADLKVGDTIHIKGHSDDYTEKVTSMQLDHEPIQEGHAGESVGVAVPVKVHEHSEVTKVVPKAAPQAAKAKPATQAKKAKPAKKAKKAKARKAKPARKAKKAGRKTKTAKGKKAGRKAKAPKRKAAKGKRAAGRRKR